MGASAVKSPGLGIRMVFPSQKWNLLFLSTNSLEEFCHTFIERFRFLPLIIGNTVWAGSAPVLCRSSDHFHGLSVVQLKLPLCWHRYTLVASEPHTARASHDSPLLFLSGGTSSIPFQPRYYQYISVFFSHRLDCMVFWSFLVVLCSDDFLEISSQPARVQLKLRIYPLYLLSRLPSQKSPLKLS